MDNDAKIAAALGVCGYPVEAMADGWIVNGEARPVLEYLAAAGARVDGVITDPPWMSPAHAYPVESKGGAKLGSGRLWSDTLTMKESFYLTVKLLRDIQRGGAAVFFCGSAVSISVFTELTYPHWRRSMLTVWNKKSGRINPPFSHLCEFALYCDDGQHNGYAGHQWHGNVFDIKTVHSSKRVHPAEKPEELLECYARIVAPPGGIVLDCFAGSFSTMRAARNVGRRYLCVEADKEFFSRAVDLAKRQGTRKGLGL